MGDPQSVHLGNNTAITLPPPKPVVVGVLHYFLILTNQRDFHLSASFNVPIGNFPVENLCLFHQEKPATAEVCHPAKLTSHTSGTSTKVVAVVVSGRSGRRFAVVFVFGWVGGGAQHLLPHQHFQ